MTVIEARAAVGARKWWALAGLSLAVLAVALDATVLSVALPTLAVSLHASASDLQWFVSVLHAGAGRRAAAGRAAGGPVRPQEDDDRRPHRVRPGLAGVRLLAQRGRVHRRPDADRAERGLHDPAGDLGGRGDVHRGGAAQGDRHLGRGQLPGPADRADPRRLAAVPPLVGLGVLDEPAGGRDRAGRGHRAGARVPGQPAPGLDPAGIVTSCAGLGVLIYGFIAAGQYGWTSATAITAMVAGAAILAAFAGWELRLSRRPGGQPLVDLGLFRSARFTWGTILAAFGVFAMFGLLFAAPQFFQAVLGVNAMGSGLRLLPMMGGLVVGFGLATLMIKPVTAKLTAALGFAVLAAGLVLGTTMTAGSSTAFIATWTAITGAGFGLSLGTAASAALADMPKESAGVASGVMQAVQKAGAPLSAAVLGSVLAAGYHARSCTWPGCRPRPPARCAAACSPVSPWRTRPGRPPCLTKFARPLCTASTRCCGPAQRWRWPASCWRCSSCPGAPRRRPQPAPPKRSGKGENPHMSAQPDHAIPGPGNAGAAAPGRHRHGHHKAALPGLRERKKAKTRAAIREHALRLFREQGYEATTVEQIAEAAEVSHSTFFRYFPTKEDVVLQDDMELLWIDALRAQPPGMPPIAALRASLHDAFASLSADDLAKIRDTTDFALSVPAVRARMLDELARTIQVMATAIAERTGRDEPQVGGVVVTILTSALASLGLAAPRPSDDIR